MKASRNIRSHCFDSVLVSAAIFLNTFHLPLMPIAAKMTAKGDIKVCIMAKTKNRAIEPRFGKNVNVPPLTIARVLPFGSVGLHFQL